VPAATEASPQRRGERPRRLRPMLGTREPRMGKVRLMSMPTRTLQVTTPWPTCRAPRLMLGVGAVLVAAGCGTGHGSQLQGASASDACHQALGARTASAESVTLGTARDTSPGGPAGFYPARNAFPDMPAATKAAWCWAKSSLSSPGTSGQQWDWYLAIPGGRSQKLMSLTSTDAPHGVPNIK
jgi:hypothetical protein